MLWGRNAQFVSGEAFSINISRKKLMFLSLLIGVIARHVEQQGMLSSCQCNGSQMSMVPQVLCVTTASPEHHLKVWRVQNCNTDMTIMTQLPVLELLGHSKECLVHTWMMHHLATKRHDSSGVWASICAVTTTKLGLMIDFCASVDTRYSKIANFESLESCMGLPQCLQDVA